MENNFRKYCHTIESSGGSSIIVRLFNNKDTFKISRNEKLIHNVTWYFEDGNLCIEGYEDELHYTDSPIELDNLDYTVYDSDIKKDRGLKLFGKTICEPFYYVKGRYRFVAKNHVKIILKNYSIKIYD